ncbi:phage tail tape measure protein [Flavobacterium frigoris]|uniref:Phage-related minor tail protein n=1 Tax=Flavobacterium frigoris TaxID=229204 RepID=A0A1H9LJJ0_FLAFI|nr:phage tail tape measure protein [Flavobacterium frigoris]SER11682.1 Phage-related minor tail protein [Flavobacterium frigoris]
MAKKSKLELVMELSDKLFNNKLSQVQAKLSGATDKMESKLQRFNLKQIKVFSNFGKALDPTAMNNMSEIVENLSQKLDFTKSITNTKTMLAQMGVENINEMSTRIHKLGKVWEANDDDIAKSANALTKQLGGSFESNLAILQQGYEKGANLNGDMLDQFKEYAPQIKELGLNASDMMVIMANAGKNGVFSDKAIDSIKEANLSLKEMGPAQMAALKGIGLDFERDLRGKTSFQAVQMISKAMEGANAQAKQLALTDIFKGAGEDAGMGFILGLSSMDLDPRKLPNIKQADEGLKGFIAGIESYVSEKVGAMMPYLQGVSMSIVTLASLTTVIQALTTAQWFSNLAAAASPYMWVALAIGAVIGVVVLAIKYFDDWGAMVLVFMGPIGRLIVALKLIYDHWDSIVNAFKSDGILGGLKRIGQVLLDVILKPLQQILETIANFDPTGLAQKGAEAIRQFRSEQGLITTGEVATIGNVDATDPLGLKGIKTPDLWGTKKVEPTSLLKAPVLDGKLAGTGGKNKKQGEEISKVAGEANQVKKVDIRIDAFNKGGINVSQSAYAGMTKEDVEAWFKEMMQRVLINAETA